MEGELQLFWLQSQWSKNIRLYYLQIDKIPGLFLNLHLFPSFFPIPFPPTRYLITTWDAIGPKRIRPTIKCTGGPFPALHTLRPSYLSNKISNLMSIMMSSPGSSLQNSLKAGTRFAFPSTHYQESNFVSFEHMTGLPFIYKWII